MIGRIMRKLLPCLVLLVLWYAPSQADTVMTFSGSSGNLAASATFDLDSSTHTLTVLLTNTSTHDVLVPTDVLTGLFFNTTHPLTPGQVTTNGSVFYGSLGDPNTGWGYKSGVSAQGKNSAISATGAVSGLGHSDFNGTNAQLQGLDYGILSAGDNTGTGNAGVTGHGPLIKNSVLFTLTAADGFSLSELGTSVVFQYGTDLSETHYTGTVTTPEPSSLLVFGSAIGWLGFALRRYL